MPPATEFTIQMEDRPGALGRLCRALADRGVSIVAFEAFSPKKGISAVRLVADDPAAARAVLAAGQFAHSETQVAQTRLPHLPGSLALVAEKLGEANMNIQYAYVGVEPGTNAPIIIFGVADVGRATRFLESLATAA